MCVGVDQARDDPSATQVYLSGSPGELERRARSNGFDPTPANDEGGIRQRWAAGAINEGRSDQRQTIRLYLPAGEEKQPSRKLESVRSTADHWTSDREGSSTLRTSVP